MSALTMVAVNLTIGDGPAVRLVVNVETPVAPFVVRLNGGKPLGLVNDFLNPSQQSLHGGNVKQTVSGGQHHWYPSPWAFFLPCNCTTIQIDAPGFTPVPENVTHKSPVEPPNGTGANVNEPGDTFTFGVLDQINKFSAG